MVMSLIESLTRIKNAVYGREVREAIHDGVFRANQIADNAVSTADQTQIRQDNLETYNDQMIQEMTDKDVISAPEIIQARGGKPTLQARLDETATQLAETNSQITKEAKKTSDFILLSDYCSDNTGTTPVDSGFLEAFNYAKAHKLKLKVDGKFLLENNYIVENDTLTEIIGDSVDSSQLIFDLDTTAFALEIKSYHIRPCKIKSLTITQKDPSKLNRNGLKVDFGGWGGSVDMENVNIFNFTGVVYNPVNTFNCRQHNVQLYGRSVEPYTSTLLKITKSPGVFSNVSDFTRCGFQYGKIAIQNLGGANYSFRHCQFEHLNLFLHTPLITDPGVSNRTYFSNNWFEKVAKGIINADMNEDTLEPITPISNRSNLNFLYFDSNYDGGLTPITVLSTEIEPEASKNFTLSAGNRTVLYKFNGWQNVPLTNGWTGTLKTLRRADGLVVLIATGLKPDMSPAPTSVATLPFNSEGAVSISAINGNSAEINPNAFWLNGNTLFKPASAIYGGAPHSFSIMYYERQ